MRSQCQMAFEVHGTRGALRWDFQRMNELELSLVGDDPAREGYTRILSGPSHPAHENINPGPALSLSYDDLKTIEACRFLESIAAGVQGEPGFAEALAVAEVQAALERSWASQRWEEVSALL